VRCCVSQPWDVFSLDVYVRSREGGRNKRGEEMNKTSNDGVFSSGSTLQPGQGGSVVGKDQDAIATGGN